ncbi:MAG: GNAT family N-acetyltransferase [Bacteroidota bacterium]
MHIKQADIATVVQLSRRIPEFSNPYETEIYEEKLKNVSHLILMAYEDDLPIGFKVGYEREEGSFYSWMGAVLPSHRRKGVAQRLADVQEDWARAKGYPSITFKTRNYLKAMLTFGINNGFNIFKIEEHETIEEYRIWLRKEL